MQNFTFRKKRTNSRQERENIRSTFNRKSSKEDGVIIRKWEGEANNKDYITEIKKDNIHFIIQILLKMAMDICLFQTMNNISEFIPMIFVVNTEYTNIQIK